jgi:hypothetical protein
MQAPEYRLRKDFSIAIRNNTDAITFAEGLIYTEDYWIKNIPILSVGDCKRKKDWFEDVKQKERVKYFEWHQYNFSSRALLILMQHFSGNINLNVLANKLTIEKIKGFNGIGEKTTKNILNVFDENDLYIRYK